MATNTVTDTVAEHLEALAFPMEDQQRFTKVPGGFEVERAGSKWFTGTAPNADYVPPKEFEFIKKNLTPLPLNPKNSTEIPQKLNADYTDVSYQSTFKTFSHI
jgi:hypothetical protein